MIGRISIENFLLHFIDYFELEEIRLFYYIILSAKINNEKGNSKVGKLWELYPSTDLILTLEENVTYERFKKEYYGELDEAKGNIYSSILAPILHHNHSFMLIYSEKEQIIADVFCEYLEDKFKLKCINFDKLFTDGETDVFYIDKDKIHDHSVEISRDAAKRKIQILETTRDGRQRLLSMMNKKDMKHKLKELGLNTNNLSDSDLIKLLDENWVNDDELDE